VKHRTRGNGAHAKAKCPACRHRAWREIAGFLVMGCTRQNLRFGLAPDIKRGYVNREGGCVAMPGECGEYA